MYYLVYIGNKSTDRWVVCVTVHENVKALCIFPSMSISVQIAVKLEKKVTKKITKGDTLSKWLLLNTLPRVFIKVFPDNAKTS